jgi:hypothetical protein
MFPLKVVVSGSVAVVNEQECFDSLLHTNKCYSMVVKDFCTLGKSTIVVQLYSYVTD